MSVFTDDDNYDWERISQKLFGYPKITRKQYMILKILKEHGPLSADEIAEKLNAETEGK